MNRLRAVIGLALCLAAVSMASPASAQGERGGDVTIVSESGSPIVKGDTATRFGLQPPEGAACQGDSANGGYRVATFLVPVGDDPGVLVYGELAPAGEGRWSVWDASTTKQAVNLFTAISAPGEPGPLTGLPTFTFDVGLLPGEIAPGDYRFGLACTLYNQTTRYWDTTVTVAQGPDESNPITWTTNAPPSGSSSGPARVAVPVVLGLAVVAGVVLVVRNRSKAQRADQLQETS